jgi:hypothetical protein
MADGRGPSHIDNRSSPISGSGYSGGMEMEMERVMAGCRILGRIRNGPQIFKAVSLNRLGLKFVIFRLRKRVRLRSPPFFFCELESISSLMTRNSQFEIRKKARAKARPEEH